MCLLCSSKKSVSANQIQRMLGVTYKTAWFMCHRTRLGMTPQRWAEVKWTGTVDVDETFVEPKAKPKSVVVALVERQGLARVMRLLKIQARRVSS